MTRTLPWLIALTAAGCTSGTVTMPDELDAFGGARSGVWLVVTSIAGGDVQIDHSLVLSNEAGFCKRAQRAYPAIGEAMREFYSSYGSIDYDDEDYYKQYCEMYDTAFSAFGEASKPVIHGGANLLSLSVRRSGAEAPDAPAAGTYRSYDDCGGYYSYYEEPADCDDGLFWGSVAMYESNPYLEAAVNIDCTDVDSYDDWYSSFYQEFSRQEPMDVNGGTLAITSSGDTQVKAELTGASLGDAGGLTMSGTFSRCDVQVDGYVYLPGL